MSTQGADGLKDTWRCGGREMETRGLPFSAEPCHRQTFRQAAVALAQKRSGLRTHNKELK